MYLIKTVRKNITSYLDIPFLLKFIFLIACMYSFNMLYIKMTCVGTSLYSPLLTQYLDYISWLRVSILYVADIIVHLFGLPSRIIHSETLFVSKGISVTMAWPCIGLGIMSFWIAYIVAQDNTWKQKLYWSFIGIVVIWLMNCWRVALLLIALANQENLSKIDHHRLFNICCYILIIGMMYWHYTRSKKINTNNIFPV